MRTDIGDLIAAPNGHLRMAAGLAVAKVLFGRSGSRSADIENPLSMRLPVHLDRAPRKAMGQAEHFGQATTSISSGWAL